MADYAESRREMVERQLVSRRIRDPLVLAAMGLVAREAFVREDLREFAYQDTALPIDGQATLSQPFIVALMAEAARLGPQDRVLEIGTGSGYGAAVLAAIVAEVYTIERSVALAERAAQRLAELGYTNIHVQHGNGTLGLPQHAPYDAIIVTAGGPQIPATLEEQLAPGGRLIIPVGESLRLQSLRRVTRKAKTEFHVEDLGPVQFVPLIGREGWSEEDPAPAQRPTRVATPQALSLAARPLPSIEGVDLFALFERIGEARIVCLGEASHGTSEFYRMRARITEELVTRKGFNFVAIEADWPDAARLDHYVRYLEPPQTEWIPFARFPTWTWSNNEVRRFIDWLRAHNGQLPPRRRVAIHGLDLYSTYASLNAALRYLENIDAETAEHARARYGCLSPYGAAPLAYRRAALTPTHQACEREVTAMLASLYTKRMAYQFTDGERFAEALEQARVAANAEQYYRAMYYGSVESWNLRNRHMFETLLLLLAFHGLHAKAVVWAHNAHLGDASATEMHARGGHSLGELCRQRFGDQLFLLGFGTDHGTVAAASTWGAPLELKELAPAHERSYERLCHETGIAAFFLPLRDDLVLRRELLAPRLERGIGLVYPPQTELASQYFEAVLPRQFDEYIYFDETQAIHPLDAASLAGTPASYPFIA